MEREENNKMNWLVNPPFFIKTLYNSFFWNTLNDEILLTFDDGPLRGNTDLILKKLDEHNFKAMFFCVGNNIKNESNLAREILSEGHSIGNHCYNHRKVIFNSQREIYNEINSVQELVKDKLNYEIKYFRPPHGRFGFNMLNVLNQLDLKCCMWSLLTYDYENKLNKSLDLIEKNISNNSILVLHDSIKSSDIILELIDGIAKIADNNNYKIGSPVSCLSA